MQKDVGDGDPKNADFPHGSCGDDHAYGATNTGCGWIGNQDVSPETKYYISPNAILAGQNLLGLNLSNANLKMSNLTNTNLSYANLSNANLTNTILTGANPTNAVLTGMNLTGMIFTGMKISDFNVNSSTICPNGIHYVTAGNNCLIL